MKSFLAAIGFLFLAFTLGVVLLVWRVRRRIMSFRDAMQNNMDDEEFRRRADKNYYRKHRDDTPPFDDDYFKGDPTGQRSRQQQQPKRRTTTAQGVTIIDERTPADRDRKIFNNDDGEYVDFREEN